MENTSAQIILEWIVEKGLSIVAIIAVAFLLLHYSNRVVARLVRVLTPSGSFTDHDAEKKREDTLIEVFGLIVHILIYFGTVFIVLVKLGVPVAPLIAATGLVSVAIGFGAQYVVRDIITGIFLVVENQFGIGDLIAVNDIRGTVESLNLRIVKIRGAEGALHFIPNGEIKTVSNFSKDYAKINMDIGVAYDTDLERLEKVIDSMGETLASDERYSQFMIDSPKFVRVSDFGPSEILVRVSARVTPGKQWEIGGEIRAELKKAFEKNNIEIPFPQRVVHTVQTEKTKNSKGNKKNGTKKNLSQNDTQTGNLEDSLKNNEHE